MIELYMNLLRKKELLLEDIPLYWKNQIINRLEDEKILGDTSNEDLFEEILTNIEQDYTDKDIEEYLNAQNDTAELDEGVTGPEAKGAD